VLGAVLVFLAVIGEAAYTIFGRIIARDVPPFTMATWICIYATVMFTPLALWDLRGFDPGAVPASTWAAITYLALVVTVVAIVLWFRGLAVIPASIAGAFTGMIPVTAVISAALLLGERVGWPHVAGIACVLAGIVMVATARGKAIGQALPESVEIVPGERKTGPGAMPDPV
jgi:drug/metabolite transporter (DMT)-like permease